MRYEVSGSILSFLVGLMLFINLPSLINAILLTVSLTLIGAALGYICSVYGVEKGLGLSILVFVVLLGFSVIDCEDFIGEDYPPAENRFTGSQISGGFDGFRLTLRCDNREYPWYYDYNCEKHNNTSYCMRESRLS